MNPCTLPSLGAAALKAWGVEGGHKFPVAKTWTRPGNQIYS